MNPSKTATQNNKTVVGWRHTHTPSPSTKTVRMKQTVFFKLCIAYWNTKQSTDFHDEPGRKKTFVFSFQASTNTEQLAYFITHILAPLQKESDLIHLFDAEFIVALPTDYMDKDKNVEKLRGDYCNAPSPGPEPIAIDYRYQRLPVSMALPAIRLSSGWVWRMPEWAKRYYISDYQIQ